MGNINRAVDPVITVAGDTGDVVLDKIDVGLSNVDNTSDINKPVSIPAQTALNGKVDDAQVLTDVPLGAVFTDTTYSVGDGGLTEINFTSADNIKLDGIEAGATADQTGAEIKLAYESELNTNAYTDAEKTKLAGIETAATADQTGAEIKLAYEAELDTNAYTDAEQSKLAGIEVGATADQTASEILTAIKTVDGTGSGLDADLLDGVDSAGFVQTTNNTSLNTDTRNTRGATRLYRKDDNSDYSIQTYWTGSLWRLDGYVGDTVHAGVHVTYADSAGSASGLGVGQTWANVTASRAVNVTYTNSTGKPIQVVITTSNSNATGGGISFVVNGVTVVSQNILYEGAHISTVVPNGQTYRLNLSGLTVSSWAELS